MLVRWKVSQQPLPESKHAVAEIVACRAWTLAGLHMTLAPAACTWCAYHDNLHFDCA